MSYGEGKEFLTLCRELELGVGWDGGSLSLPLSSTTLASCLHDEYSIVIISHLAL
jgi:hypothetical protein